MIYKYTVLVMDKWTSKVIKTCGFLTLKSAQLYAATNRSLTQKIIVVENSVGNVGTRIL